MSVTSGFLTEQQRELMSEASEQIDAHKEETGPRPPIEHATKHVPANPKHSSPAAVKEKKSHTGKNGKPKKGGSGGKGTWGSLLAYSEDVPLDRHDPNYDSEEEPYKLVGENGSQPVEDYKAKIATIVEEYFTSGSVSEAATDLLDLGSSNLHHLFVKKLVSSAMDKHDREREMASALLSALYSDVITSRQLAKGFMKLLESLDDFSIDIPNAKEELSSFVARAVVDDILPPAFITKALKSFPAETQAATALLAAETNLATPHHAERIERCWGGGAAKTAEEVKAKFQELLVEFLSSKDVSEACRCIRELNMPFFHHEVVKRALTLAVEKDGSGPVLKLLKDCADSGLITSNQMRKGFARAVDSAEDLTLDVPHARESLISIVSEAAKEGWLDDRFATVALGELESSPTADMESPLDSAAAAEFKEHATRVIQEYFSSGDIGEVARSLEELAPPPEFHHLFVKRLITLAMDRKVREHEMASVLLSVLAGDTLSAVHIGQAFSRLLESLEDLALDIPDASQELALFLERLVVDDVLAPLYVSEMAEELPQGSLGLETVHMAQAVLSARHAGERVLRCWGGGTAVTVEEAKDRIGKLLEEFEAGGELAEACQCIRDLDMPFFHHELVKQTLIVAMEKQNFVVLELLKECASEGLVTTSQMSLGFGRVFDRLDDLALDNPRARQVYDSYVSLGQEEGWLAKTFRPRGGPAAVASAPVLVNGSHEAKEEA